MEDFKFKVGDRVRVVKIDDDDCYQPATYNVGDVGTVIRVYENSDYGNVYKIHFDRPGCLDWWALESWLMRDKPLINCE